MDDRLVPVEQQLADLAELKVASQRRHALPRDTPEWLAAVREEAEIVERVRRWSQPADRKGSCSPCDKTPQAHAVTTPAPVPDL
jgi:hypothetical protein